VIPETPQPQKRRGKGLLIAIAYFTGVAVLIGAIYLLAPTSSSTDTTAEAGATTTTTSTGSTVQVSSPSYIDSEEPIADAADVILPSVVQIQTNSGLGSGVIYDPDGLIITAAHVVDGQDTVLVRFEDGEQVEGEVVGAVSSVDIAVVKVDKTGLPAATFTTEKPRVGQMAIAVGSPWGLQSTVTAGIISAVDQTSCEIDTCASLLQTDAAINPGNSGGALVNREGEVVGINVSIFSTTGSNDGVGFAVPSDIATSYAESIISGEPIEAPFLGVSVDDVTIGRAGALVSEVISGTAAEDAGIEVGDLIVELAGVPILSREDLVAQVRSHRAGENVDVTIVRNNTEMTIQVTLGVRTADLS
jgi:S1-C subfamily serine protease